MSDAQATILAIAAGLALALVLGASLRRRRTVGYVVQPFDKWTDAELDRLYAGLMADEESDEHEEWGFV